MRGLGFLVGVIIAIFWALSFSFLLIPDQLQSGPFSFLHYSVPQFQAQGLVIFLLSMLILLLYAVSIPDEKSPD